MALYRILSRTRLPKPSLNPKSTPICLHRRFSSKAEIIEIDMDSASSPAKIEEMLQKVMVRKATPDWLPFLPGSSFWVPPTGQAPRRVVDLIGQLKDKLDHEEWLSLTTARGWPCSSFFLKDNGLTDDAVEEAVVVIKVLADSDIES